MRRFALLLLLLLAGCLAAAHALRVGLKQRVFRDKWDPQSRAVSGSDPANNPLTAASFLAEGADAAPLANAWENALHAPQAKKLDGMQILMKSQRQAQQAHAESSDPSLLQWVEEGKQVKNYEPGMWPKPALLPNPGIHLVHHDGAKGVGVKPHNLIEGSLGVQSAAIPWDWRSHAGIQNPQRKVEPLVYTPLVLAKTADGDSAIDLTSIVNRGYQLRRRSENPQYAPALSALTDYEKAAATPTDKWLPQAPTPQNMPGFKKKSWEKHFLDLYAPTPPPLLSPVAPRMRKTASQLAAERASTSLAEIAAASMPEFLTRGERVSPLVTPLLDSGANPVAFRDIAAEEAALKAAHEIDIFAPAAVLLEEESEIVDPALRLYDVDTPVPQTREDEFPW